MMANLGAGLVLLHKYDQQYNTRNNTNVDSHIAIIDADNIIAVEDTNSSPVDEKDHSIFSFIPVLSCILITFGYACGLGPVPFILFGELFPSSVRGSATSITAFLRSITVFLSIKIFPSLLWFFDIGGSFISCAAVCAFAIVVSYLCVPETKGMDTKQLESIYSGRQSFYREEEEASVSSLLAEDSSKASPRGQDVSAPSDNDGRSKPVRV